MNFSRLLGVTRCFSVFSTNISMRCSLNVVTRSNLSSGSPLNMRNSFFKKKYVSDVRDRTSSTIDINTSHLDPSAVRKRDKRKILKQNNQDRIVGFGLSDSLDLNNLQKAIEKEGLYAVVKMPPDAQDVLVVQAIHTPTDEERHIFFFNDGGVVFWNMSDVEVRPVDDASFEQLPRQIKKFVNKNIDERFVNMTKRDAELKVTSAHRRKAYPASLVKEESDTLALTETSGATRLNGCDVLLRKPQTEEEALDCLLEKYTVSKALALSVKLSCIEHFQEEIAEYMEMVTEDMLKGQIRISKRDMLQQVAKIIQLRHYVNCKSDLLDVPDFFWDRPWLEELFMRGRNEFDLNKRVNVLIKRLEHSADLLENLKAQVNDQVHLKLEWLIVVLIAIEVLFEVDRRFRPSLRHWLNPRAAERDEALRDIEAARHHNRELTRGKLALSEGSHVS